MARVPLEGRFKVTIRGKDTEIRGYATWEALNYLGSDPNAPYVVVASPVEGPSCLHMDVTGLCCDCGQVPVEGVD